MKYTLTIIMTVLLAIGAGQTANAQTTDLQTENEAAVARTKQGLVAGYRENGVYIYKGIPYAKAKRFMPPREADQWEGVRSCRAYGPNCPQGTRSAWKTDELAFAYDWEDWHADEKNCLCINVWTAGLDDGARRPVMVWMHPGGYTGGSGNEMPCFDGTRLALLHNVVVVTFNQRLNELGFLDLSAYGEKYAKSGNVGMLDAVAALQWVHDNIESFGGDPDNVTIFGQSGGGGKVSVLMAMPGAKGLFHKAIVQSGSMINTMEQRYSRMIADSTLKNLGLSPSEVDKLARLPYETLHKAGQKAIKQVRPIATAEGAHSFIFGWAPVVDGDVLPWQPSSPEAMDFSRDIPLIVGSTLTEQTLSAYNADYRDPTLEQARDVLAQKFGDRADEYITLYDRTYGDATAKNIIDLDFEFRPNVLNQARLKAAAGGAPVYVYLFDWVAPVMDGLLKSVHCSDIPYVFDNVQLQSHMTGGGPDAQALADKMSGAWTSFARTGTPSAENLPAWEPFNEDTGATMILGKDCRVEHNYDKALIEFICSFPTRGLTATQD
ncbi:MAG: carboxylesterase family protein [Bacteroidales bacterium]|nr:carboxylesterase family protein [Bacteroidales bacterium]